ncbi:unnamed protein product [Haemophilus parainfluenzae T3T1]|uniref:Uncharacterized protein n=1 Tax=Haemophilus parainfluenzae (strain T3T1) TaxID=862965 RepID=A0AB33QL48_HAEP3|nr:unnamed protein product [Haemophilus parainfluenzae T3T1]
MSCFSGLMAGGLPSAILCYQKQHKKQIGIFRLMVSVST